MLMIRIRKLILWIQRLFMRPEPWLNAPPADAVIDPIFIVGPPRTGSTLLSQLMVMHFKVGYITNLMALLPMFFSRIARFSRKKILGYSNLKDSDYGVIRGLHSPNEAAKINDWWFNDVSSETHRNELRKSVWNAQKNIGAPILIKSMGNALRIGNLLKVFPNARFIYITRDIMFNAQSILIAREEIFGSRNEWWSLKPAGFEKIMEENDPFYQIMWQLREIDTKIRNDLKELNPGHIILDYDELCRETSSAIEMIGRKFNLESQPCATTKPEVLIREMWKLGKDEWERFESARKLVFGQ